MEKKMTAEEYLDQMLIEDKVTLTHALQGWKDDGVANPMIPLDMDVDGDGFADAFGLDDAGNLILLSTVPIVDTVSVSLGGGAETDWEEGTDG
jgi:hypothetical protein